MPSRIRLFLGIILLLFTIRLGIGLARPFVNQAPTAQPTLTPSAIPSRTPQPTATRTLIPTRTPTPSATPVPSSKILYQEDFQDELSQSWGTFVGSWSMASEGANHYWVGTGQSNYPQAWLNESYSWDNYAFETRIRIRQGGVFLCLRSATGSSFYNVFVNSNDTNIEFAEYLNGTYSTFGQGRISVQRNRWYTMRFEVKGNELRFYIDNKLIMQSTRASISSGGIGYYMGGGDEVHFDDIRVWSLE